MGDISYAFKRLDCTNPKENIIYLTFDEFEYFFPRYKNLNKEARAALTYQEFSLDGERLRRFFR